MAGGDERSVTVLLRDWNRGDQSALDALIPRVYAELRQIASRQMRGERGDHTLQTTALVHEAYVRLIDADISWNDRGHFYVVAAQAMRRILVDHARARRSAKRGDGAARVELRDDDLVEGAPDLDILELDRALEALGELDDRKARVVELHYFGGLAADEIARCLDTSPRTVSRDMRFARAWLRTRMESA